MTEWAKVGVPVRGARIGMHKLGVALAVALACAGGLSAETLTWTGAR